MKYLLVLLVIVVAWWWITSRVRAASKPTPRKAPKGASAPLMIECAHCGLNLPRAEAVHDAAGRAFCSDVHRIAGPK